MVIRGIFTNTKLSPARMNSETTVPYIVANRCDQKQVPGNCLIWFLIMCPIINTILAIYFWCKHNNHKESLKILFSND